MMSAWFKDAVSGLFLMTFIAASFGMADTRPPRALRRLRKPPNHLWTVGAGAFRTGRGRRY